MVLELCMEKTPKSQQKTKSKPRNQKQVRSMLRYFYIAYSLQQLTSSSSSSSLSSSSSSPSSPLSTDSDVFLD